jgi:hypothetical protein
MPDNVEKLLFQLDLEDIGVHQGIDHVYQQLGLLKKVTRAVGQETKRHTRIVDKENKELKETAKATVKVTKALKTEETQRKKVNRAIDATAKARRESLEQARQFGDVETGIRPVTGAIGFLGGAKGQQFEQVANIGPELLAAVEGVGLLRQQLPQLTENLVKSAGGVSNLALGMGVFAIAAAAVVVTLKAISDASKESVQRAKVQIETQRQLSDLQISTLTTKEINEEKRAIEELNVIRRREREALVESHNELLNSMTYLEKMGEATGVANKGVDDYARAIEELDKEVASSEVVFKELDDALGSASAAAADLKAREQELADERERLLGIAVTRELTKIKERSKLRADAEIKAQTATTAGVLAEQEKLHIKYRESTVQMRELSELYGRGFMSLAEYRVEQGKLLVEQDNLIFQMGLLRDVVMPAAEANEAQAKALAKVTAVSDAAKAALDNMGGTLDDNVEKLEDYAEKTAEIEASRALKLSQDAEKFALERVNDLADHYKDMAELDRDYYVDRGDLLTSLREDLSDISADELDALRDHNKDSQRAAEDHYERLAEIQNSAQSDIASAAGRLDAIAILEAQERAEKDLELEDKQYKKEQKRREEDFRDQLAQFKKLRRETLKKYRQDLRDLESQHRRERMVKEVAFREQLRREDQQRAMAAQHQQQSWALEDSKRAAHFGIIRNATTSHYQTLETITIEGMSLVQAAFAAGIAGMDDGGAVGAPSFTLGNLPLNFFASGGVPPLHRDVMVGERGPEIVRFKQPARIYPSGQMPNGFDGASIVINIDGTRDPLNVGFAVRRELSNLMGVRG